MPSEPITRIDEPAAQELILAWARSKARIPDPTTIDVTTPLFEQRLLVSLHIPELLLLLERLTGAPVDVGCLAAGDFRDVVTIVRRFCVAPE